jgi:hypothetical protein
MLECWNAGMLESLNAGTLDLNFLSLVFYDSCDVLLTEKLNCYAR